MYLLVQEQQRRQRLPVRGNRHLPLSRQQGKNSLDLGLADFARVAHAVEANESAHPMDVSLRCPYAVVSVTNPLTHLAKQYSGNRRKSRHGAGLHFALTC